MELNYHERSDREQSLTKTKQNNVTDHIGVVYEESETKLSWPVITTQIVLFHSL